MSHSRELSKARQQYSLFKLTHGKNETIEKLDRMVEAGEKLPKIGIDDHVQFQMLINAYVDSVDLVVNKKEAVRIGLTKIGDRKY